MQSNLRGEEKKGYYPVSEHNVIGGAKTCLYIGICTKGSKEVNVEMMKQENRTSLELYSMIYALHEQRR